MNKLGWLLFALVVLYFIFFIRQDIIDNLSLKEQYRLTKINVVKETIRQKQLKIRLSQLGKNDYLEKMARTKLGLIKKGEQAYKVIN